MEDAILEVITIASIRALANTAIKETAEFLKLTYKEHKSLKQISTQNEDLVTSIAKLMQVKTLFTGSDRSVNLFDFFQKPKLKYNDSTVIIENIEEIRSKSINNIVFVGTVGQGKSILMRYLAIQDLIENTRIPIFIELKNISKNKNVKDLVKEYIGVWVGLDDKIIELILKSGKISIFLDAFDEIDSDLAQEACRDIATLGQNYNKLRISVSSRPQTILTHSPLFDIVNLKPYEKEEQDGLINKLVKNPENVRVLIDSIEKSSHEVKKVLTTPLMVVLYINQYNVGFSIPQHVTDFYKNIFDIVTFTHDRSKGIEKRKSFSTLNQDQLEKIFERFCFETFLLHTTIFDRDKFIELLKKSLSKNNINDFNDYYNLISDYTRFACLILKDGNKYTFIHKSIQEFYVAKFISSLPEKIAENVISKKFIAGNYSNDNYIKFLEVINPYYYNKFYLLNNLINYSQLFDIQFIDDKSNYIKFLNSLYVTNMKSDFRMLKVMCGSTNFVSIYSQEIFEIVDELIALDLVTEKAIRWGSEENREENKSITNAIKNNVIVKNIWEKICIKYKSYIDKVNNLETSVLDEELEF